MSAKRSSDFGMQQTSLRLREWLWIGIIWFGIGLFSASQTVYILHAQGLHYAGLRLFLTEILGFVPWALATPLIQRLGRQFSPLRWRSLTTWAVHLVAFAGIAIASAVWLAAIEGLINPWPMAEGPGPFGRVFVGMLYNRGLENVVLYVLILATSSLLDWRERLAYQQTETARLGEALAKAQLYALRRQFEPQFLLEAMNSISCLIRENNNEAAATAVEQVNDFLQRLLSESDRQEVALGEEMDFVQKYLDMQKLRFAERLQLDMQIPRELLSAQLPTLVLQPLAENAVKHGIAKRAQGGTIRISACRLNDMLNLTVYNDAPKHRAGPTSGIAVANVRSRLQRLYGDKFELHMRDQESGGVEVSLSVPFRQK
jgi:two-component system LytT family sensor kinase